ncbi:aminotransferase class I/II-fold pyridoxal phosphate-dependent enzyme [Streptomyces erythrochromogenes]|uniref:Aminotransferase n=1 Tax=Streptomyces erythrochromogenes TaxID=285574 RepID=A0ABZ1Q644_9ACTN|nr:aminotransferase class I/II-fold pyridoxal phosphate-dependent enzyme [Streptomyces erythrochromogenes]
MSGARSWSRDEALALAGASGHRPLDLSLGIPCDPPPRVPGAAHTSRQPRARVTAAYPPSAGTPQLRDAITGYLLRRYAVAVPPEAVAACVGSKEFISTLPLFLRDLTQQHARGAGRDTVLIPALGYPSYAFGARLAGLRVHRVPVDETFRIRLDRIAPHVVSRALCLWVNSPANPTGVVEDLDRVAAWGRAHGVLVVSDEAYAETTWCHEPRTVLRGGLDGVLTVHSLSKRSNAPGLRVGFYAGDPTLVAGLVHRRRQGGLMAAAASQQFAASLLADDRHAAEQRSRNARRVSDLVDRLNALGLPCASPAGGLFAWVAAPEGGGRAFAHHAAAHAGVVVTPGSEFGPRGDGYVRIAAVHDLSAIASRLALLRPAAARRRSADPSDTASQESQ